MLLEYLWAKYFLVIISSYLLGSIPSGLLFAKLLGKSDIRNHGSGNIGATNALRVGGKMLGILTFLGDIGKGIAAVVIVNYLYHDNLLNHISGLMAVVGHIFPVWLKFKGGKGVATTLAVITFLEPTAGLIFIATWLSVYLLFKISSLAALVAILLVTILSFILYSKIFMILISILCVMIYYRHISNIRRLLKNQEDSI